MEKRNGVERNLESNVLLRWCKLCPTDAEILGGEGATPEK